MRVVLSFNVLQLVNAGTSSQVNGMESYGLALELAGGQFLCFIYQYSLVKDFATLWYSPLHLNHNSPSILKDLTIRSIYFDDVSEAFCIFFLKCYLVSSVKGLRGIAVGFIFFFHHGTQEE